ncbi:MAG: hypothetical protein IJI21_05605, partial [Clostridia bacterium]|nr:hypothetical protein [Clostridia bacterium]
IIICVGTDCFYDAAPADYRFFVFNLIIFYSTTVNDGRQVGSMKFEDAASEAAFNRCMDFLARMIIKYGDQISFPETLASKEVGTGTGRDVAGIPASFFVLTHDNSNANMLLGQYYSSVGSFSQPFSWKVA